MLLSSKIEKEILKPKSSSILELIIIWLIVAGFIVAIYYNAYTTSHNQNQNQITTATNRILTCNNYVFNTFLYVILGLVLIVAICMLNDKIPIIPSFLSNIFIYNRTTTITITTILFNVLLIIIVLLVLLGLIYLTKTTDPNKTLEINVYWFSFIYILASLFYFIYVVSRVLNVFYLGCIIVIIISVITSIIAVKYPHLINPIMKRDIIIAFIFLFVITIIIPFIISDYKLLMKVYIAIIIGFIILFILFLLSEVSDVRNRASQCTIPNYPGEALMITYDIWIILRDVLRLLIFHQLRK